MIWSSKNNLLRKISSRKDLYEVSRCVSASEPLSVLQKEVADCDAMMLYGIEEQKRNDLIKFCYEKSIRIYVAPEVSDIRCVVQTASIPLTHRFSFFEIPACLLSSGL